MIVFRRKKREQIVIDGNIIVTVMHVRGTRVSLGIQAPDGVRILRTELTPNDAAALLSLAESADVMSSTLPVIS